MKRYCVWIPGIIDVKIVYAARYEVFVGNGGMYTEFYDDGHKVIGTVLGPAGVFEDDEWSELPIEPI